MRALDDRGPRLTRGMDTSTCAGTTSAMTSTSRSQPTGAANEQSSTLRVGSSPATATATAATQARRGSATAPRRSRPSGYVDQGTSYSPVEPFDPMVPLCNDTGTFSIDGAGSTPPEVVTRPPTPTACELLPPEPHISPIKAQSLFPPENHGRSTAAETPPWTRILQMQNPRPVATHTPPQRGPKVLPADFEQCDVHDMVILISGMLAELIKTNDSIEAKGVNVTRFHSRTVPPIPVFHYLQRLAEHVTLTPTLLLSMVFFMDQLCIAYPGFTINSLTVHRFLITAAAVAAKGLSDMYWANSVYARVGGIRVPELKLLELEFLFRVDWRIVPTRAILAEHFEYLVERSQGYVFEGE